MVDIFSLYKKKFMHGNDIGKNETKGETKNEIYCSCDIIREKLCSAITNLTNQIGNYEEEYGFHICKNKDINSDIKPGSIVRGGYYVDPVTNETLQYVNLEGSKCPVNYEVIGSIHTHPNDNLPDINDNLLPSVIDIEAIGPEGQNLIKCIVGTDGEIKNKAYCWYIPEEVNSEIVHELQDKENDLENMYYNISELYEKYDNINNEIQDNERELFIKQIDEYRRKSDEYIEKLRDIIRKYGCEFKCDSHE
ncbi:MAG: hypothetical protein QXL94_01800 [Candidatus Parvarchaeum sp.]